MKQKAIRVSLAFCSGPEAKLVETAGAVSSQLYEVELYAGAPVSKEELDTASASYDGSVIAQANGGPLATAQKNKRKSELTALLKQLAYFVQIRCANDMAALLSSGFEATNSNTTQSALEKPSFLEVSNGVSGQIILKTRRIANLLLFEIQFAPVIEQTAGEWVSGGFGRKASALEVNGLKPGAMYAFRIRAIGGSTGASDWSNVVSGRSL